MVISYRKKSEGFALPTVVIASVVMFAILVAVSSLVSGTRASLDTQYYEALAADAADAGGTMADACIQENNLVSQWSTSTPTRQLQPQTDCTGVDVSGQSRYLVTTPTYRSFFTVDPVSKSSSGVQTATITGTVEVLRKSTGTVQRLYSKRLVIRASGAVSVNKIAFGYVYARGAFFGTVGKDGVMRTVGYNSNGQLGNGTNQQTLTPTTFVVPGKSIVAAYTSFLSLGNDMFAVTSDGEAYGAGLNSGRIGDGASVDRLTPSKVDFSAYPSAIPIRYIAVGSASNYFLGSDSKVYSTGGCSNGRLGAGGTTDGTCVSHYSPKPVLLPAGVAATSQLVTDSDNAYVVTTNGALYGWGINEYGQLANGSDVDSAMPVKFGLFGDAGQEKITQVQFDGETVYALSDAGKVYTAGHASGGQAGNREMQFYNRDIHQCLTATSSTTVAMRDCAPGATNQRFTLKTDDTVGSTTYPTMCLNGGAGGAGTIVNMATCSNTDAQHFLTWGGDSLTNTQAWKRVTVTARNGNVTLNDGSEMRGVNMAPQRLTCSALGATEKITQISADQWSVAMLTSEGNVFMVGDDNSGQSGSGATHGQLSSDCLKFQLPAGVKGTKVYTTMGNPPDSTTLDSAAAAGQPKPAGYEQPWSTQNLMVIGDNGKVYGAGSNVFGQLGTGTTSSVPMTSAPVAMQVIDGVNIKAADVKVGFGTTVILTTSGRVYTVGNNSHGQLGDGTQLNNATPKMNRYTNEFRSLYY